MAELEEKLEKEVNEKNTRLLLDLNKEAKKHGIHCMMVNYWRNYPKELIL